MRTYPTSLLGNAFATLLANFVKRTLPSFPLGNAYVTLLTLDNAYVPAQLPYLVMHTLPYFPLGNAYATLIALDGHATMQFKCSRNAYPASGEHQPLPSQPSSSSSSTCGVDAKNY